MAGTRTLDEAGFTLVELVISMVMSGVVMIGLYVLVSGSHTYILRERNKTNLQQDFSLVEQVLANNIMQGVFGSQEIYASYADYSGSGSPQSTGSCLKLYFPGGNSVVIYKESSNFKIQKADLSITNLVTGVVDSLWFTEGTKSLQTYLALAKSGKSIDGDLYHTFRNTSGATLPDTLRPIGVGTWSNNTQVGDTPEWKCVDEVTSDGDATYIYPTYDEDWRTDTYSTTDGSGSGTIDSVRTYIRVRGLSSGDKARTVVLLGGTRYYGSTISLSGVGSYTKYSTLYTTNPATLAAWTWTDINNMEIGVRLYRDSESSGRPRCTQVWAEVYYSN